MTPLDSDARGDGCRPVTRPLRVLIVEDDQARMWVFDAVFEHDDVLWVWRSESACHALSCPESPPYDLVMLDHDLWLTPDGTGPAPAAMLDGQLLYRADVSGSGQDVARAICALPAERRPFVIVHSWNVAGTTAICNILRAGGARFVRQMFGADIGHYVNAVRSDMRREESP